MEIERSRVMALIAVVTLLLADAEQAVTIALPNA
jgi:hypothetical protein